MANQIYYYETIDSTNEEIKRLEALGNSHGTIAVAREQSAGKGRRGRQWYSPKGDNLYFSLLLCPDFEKEKASVLTLLMALSVAEVLRQDGCENAMIKWPNDIVMNGKKVCGILTEMNLKADGGYSVIVGVGINLDNAEFTEDISTTATSILREYGRKPTSKELLQKIVKIFWQNYDAYCRCQSFENFKQHYESYLANKDAYVKVLEPQGEYTGIARGINQKGELIVETEDGDCVTVYAGEVSVRGIYGYV